MPHLNLSRLQVTSISVCLIWLLSILPEAAQGQTAFYQFDVKDTTTFTTTCGTTTGSYWRTVDDSCSITFGTDTLPNCQNPVLIPVEITINASGNLECDDMVYMEYKCGGSWIMFDTLFGCNLNNVQTYLYDISCPMSTVFELRVTFVTDHNTEKLDIRDGDITIYDPCGITTLPIDNISLTGKAASQGNLLTAALMNFSSGRTWLEKSVDGKAFIPVGKEELLQAGNEKELSIWDFDVTNQFTYYRMGFEDGDGQITYSNIVAVESAKVTAPEMSFNPSNSTLAIQAKNLKKGELQIFQVNGQLVGSIPVDAFLGESRASISLNEMIQQPGAYIAVFRNDSHIVQHKFIRH